MRRCCDAVIILAVFLTVIAQGCRSDDPVPASGVKASVAVSDTATILSVEYAPAKEGDAMTANNLNFALVTAINSGLAVSKQEASLQREAAQAERAAGQTLMIGVFTLIGITIICATVMLKGKI